MSRLLAIFKDSAQSFHGQEPGENVVLLLRKHSFVLYLPLTLAAVACTVPFFIASLFSDKLASPAFFQLFLFISGVWYMGLWLVTFYFLTVYSLNTVIITNKRIIDSDQHGFFNRKVSELHVRRIQDVSVNVSGLFPTFLKFGDLVVQTAASDNRFIFCQIPDPERVKDVIMQVVSSQFSGVKEV